MKKSTAKETLQKQQTKPNQKSPGCTLKYAVMPLNKETKSKHSRIRGAYDKFPDFFSYGHLKL